MAKSKRNVNVNLGVINTETMEALSKYNVARCELIRLREGKKEELAKVDAEIKKIKEDRSEAIKNGMPRDEAIAKFDLLPLNNKRQAIDEKFRNDCKPHNASKKEALELVPDSIYYAYVLAMDSFGDLSKTGTLVTKRDRSGAVKESVKVEKPIKALVKEFALKVGLGNADNESAIDKFAACIVNWTNGMIKSNKADEFLRTKSANQYKELFLCSFLKYGFDKNVFILNEDNTVSMRDFNAETAAEQTAAEQTA